MKLVVLVFLLSACIAFPENRNNGYVRKDGGSFEDRVLSLPLPPDVQLSVIELINSVNNASLEGREFTDEFFDVNEILGRTVMTSDQQETYEFIPPKRIMVSEDKFDKIFALLELDAKRTENITMISSDSLLSSPALGKIYDLIDPEMVLFHKF